MSSGKKSVTSSILTALFCLFFSSSVLSARPHHYLWNEVILKEETHTVRAKLQPDRSSLEVLSIETPEGVFDVDSESLKHLTGVRLDTVSFDYELFDSNGEHAFFHQLSFRYAPSDEPEARTCSEETNGNTATWAPERIFYVIFEGVSFVTKSADADCDC